MWRLLPALLLMSCAAQRPNDTIGDQEGANGPRIIHSLDLPLRTSATPGDDGSLRKEFQSGETRGTVSRAGAFSLRTVVAHKRLRCATYETGIQLGDGTADCSSARWLVPVQFATNQTHCNGATRVHAGGGQLPTTDDSFEIFNCVRFVIRCSGAC